MPRKTKEQTEKEELKKEKSTAKKAATTTKKATVATKKTANTKKAVAKKSTTTTKASTAKKSATTKKATSKKATTTKKATATKKVATAKKTSTAKKTAATKKVDTAKKTSTAKKTVATKKATTKKTTSKKATSNSSTKKKVAKVEAIPIVEYYDLPYRYNQTVVKLLAQTPTTLFVYWDISDEDRKNYIKTYGEHFFEETKPVLIIKNLTMDYSFEVEINDFANSWYLHVNDSKCDYSIELGRRPISVEAKNNIKTDYIYVTTSNDIESPNDRILFNIDEQKVYYKNVKNNISSTRKVSFVNSMGKIYNLYELYKTIYKDEKIIDDMPTSSWFK